MKNTFLTLATIVSGAILFSFAGSGSLEIGDKAPMAEQKMKDVSGESYSLEDLKKKNGLLVIFSCNTCPFVIGWEDQYPKLGELTKSNDIGMVLVNSNEAKRKKDDSMEEMKEHYKEASYNTPYVVDENNRLADAFGAQTTPHVYLFDGDMKLIYKGAINDKYEGRNKTATKSFLEDAIGKFLKGEEIDPATTKHRGCSIKRAKA